jgi:tRNA threonylcarbamoyladenosine biosynthesis protein TsaB
MRVLALDTTTRAGSAAVVDDGRVLVERTGDATRSHAERLPAELLQALAATGLTTADVDLFAVASGPGSFTGLRIGIATMQGLAFVHRRRIAAISALRALAESATAAPHVQPAVRVAACMDAHRGEVFTALYDVVTRPDLDSGECRAASLIEIEGPTVSTPDATCIRWTPIGMPAIVCGDGAVKYRASFPASVIVVEPPPLAASIGRLALAAAASGDLVTPSGVQPLYVRRPDAELAREAAARRS